MSSSTSAMPSVLVSSAASQRAVSANSVRMVGSTMAAGWASPCVSTNKSTAPSVFAMDFISVGAAAADIGTAPSAIAHVTTHCGSAEAAAGLISAAAVHEPIDSLRIGA